MDAKVNFLFENMKNKKKKDSIMFHKTLKIRILIFLLLILTLIDHTLSINLTKSIIDILPLQKYLVLMEVRYRWL